MFSISDIKQEAYPAAYRRGKELYERGLVQEFSYDVYTEDGVPKAELIGRVKGKGEVADTLHQHGEQPFTALQGGVDRLGWHTIGGLCHRGQCRRISGVHHRGNGESGGLPSGGEVGRRHRSRHPAACRKAEKQGITKKQNVSTKKEKRV